MPYAMYMWHLAASFKDHVKMIYRLFLRRTEAHAKLDADPIVPRGYPQDNAPGDILSRT
jgi:hypothetical protein